MLAEIPSSKAELQTQKDYQFRLPQTDGEKAILIDLIVSNLYQNPLQSVCREIISNAVDANTEAGNEDVPIEIGLPSLENPFLSISDSGIGISPQRMENIFTQFCSSSKRGDNSEIGGFGIGAKSVLSISEQTQIITRSQGIEYTYSFYIRENGLPAISLLDSHPTEKTSGTEFKIPLDPHRFPLEKVRQNVEKLTFWFDPLPKIEGENYWEESVGVRKKAYLEFAGCWLKPPSDLGKRNKCTFSISALIGQLQYSLDYSLLFPENPMYYPYGTHHFKAEGLANKIRISRADDCNSLILKFQIGELDITANREGLRYTEKTKQLIRDRLTESLLELNRVQQAKIAEAKSLTAAKNALFFFLNPETEGAETFKYEGRDFSCEFGRNELRVECPVFLKGEIVAFRQDPNLLPKLKFKNKYKKTLPPVRDLSLDYSYIYDLPWRFVRAKNNFTSSQLKKLCDVDACIFVFSSESLEEFKQQYPNTPEIIEVALPVKKVRSKPKKEKLTKRNFLKFVKRDDGYSRLKCSEPVSEIPDSGYYLSLSDLQNGNTGPTLRSLDQLSIADELFFIPPGKTYLLDETKWCHLKDYTIEGLESLRKKYTYWPALIHFLYVLREDSELFAMAAEGIRGGCPWLGQFLLEEDLQHLIALHRTNKLFGFKQYNFHSQEAKIIEGLEEVWYSLSDTDSAFKLLLSPYIEKYPILEKLNLRYPRKNVVQDLIAHINLLEK